MVEPCFNELSVYPLCSNDEEVNQRVILFVKLLSRLRYLGISKVRYENGLNDILLKESFSLQDYCQKYLTSKNPADSKEKNYASQLVSMIRKPYLQSTEEPLLNKYSNVKYINQEGLECDCYGLYVAHILNSFSIGFDTGIESVCRLKLTNNNEKIEFAEVIHITQEQQCFDNKVFVDYMSNQDIVVPKSLSTKTNFTLPDHHGKDECQKHGDYLIKDPYVNDILNSIPFNSGESSYIHSVSCDGTIEVRLFWTKSGYGLRISTSATNIIEAWWVAKYLEKKYGK